MMKARMEIEDRLGFGGRTTPRRCWLGPRERKA